MKHLKKFTAVLLAALFVLSPLAGVPFGLVNAAELITVTTAVKDGEKVVAGEEVTFVVTLSDAVTVKSLGLDFQNAYDHSLFTWVSGEWSDRIEFAGMTHINTEAEVAGFLNQSPVVVEGEIFAFTLRANSGNVCGTTDTIKVLLAGVSNVAYEPVDVTVGHKYENICARVCDACGDERVPDEHDYESACDSDCSLCGMTRVAPHNYTSDGDDTCNDCGHVRKVDYTVLTSLSATTLKAGETVTVSVYLDKARYTRSFALDFLSAYSHDAFEWVSGDWSQAVKDLKILTNVKPGSEAIFLATSETEIPAGVIFSFVLRVKEGASCLKEYDVRVETSGIPDAVFTGGQISLVHSYTSDCDRRCDVCEKPRTPLADHTYDHECDTTCNLCGAVRLVPHSYKFACSTACLLCGATRLSAHTYSDDWDDICNVCGELRSLERTLSTVLTAKTAGVGDLVTVEVYLDNPITASAAGLDFATAYDHDAFEWVDGYFSGSISFAAYTQINAGADAVYLAAEEFTVQGLVFTMILRVKDVAVCGASYEIKVGEAGLRSPALQGDTLTIEHVYDNVCDAACNACGEERVTEGHRYDDSCDADCNECGETRPITHSFSNDGDEECDVCGETRVVERSLTTSLSATTAKAGDLITVTVSLSKPKQTKMMALELENAYDHAAFEWVSGDWSESIKAAAALIDVNAGQEAVIADANTFEISGEIFTFTLRVKSDAACDGNYAISVSCTSIENVTFVGSTLEMVHDYQWISDDEGHCKTCSACNTIFEETRGSHSYDHSGDEACNACGELRLAVYGTSLTLQHNFAMNYKVKAELLEKYTDLYLVVTRNGVSKQITEYTVDQYGYLSFCYEDIAPQTIGDDADAVLHGKANGEDRESELCVSGVARYCDQALEYYADDSYATFRTLIVDLLHYSAKAQIYTGYKADTLADATLTAEQLAWGTQGDPALNNHFVLNLKTIENPTVTWRGAGLVLDSAVTLKLKFATESIKGLKVQIAIEGGKTVVIEGEQYFTYDAENNCYVLYVNGLNANQMNRKLELTILDAEGNAISNTAQYSIESYAYEKQNSTIPGLADLVKAMMNYGNAAVAYSKK